MPMDIGEAEIAARSAEGELLVVETEQPHDRRVQIVDVNFVLGGGKTELVGRTMNVAALHSAARHPHGEAVMIVIAPVDFARV